MGVPDRLMPYTVVIVRAATVTDRYGNAVKDWNAATRTTTRAWIEQQKMPGPLGEPATGNRDELVARWVLVLPAGTDINGRDRVEYDGNTYEVVGPPQLLHDLYGPHHVEALLKWVEG